MPETIGQAFISIRADDSKFKSDVDTLGGTLNKFAKGAGTAIAAIGIGAFFKSTIAEAEEAQKVSAQTAAVIKSTGGAANVSAQQIDELTSSLSKKIGVDDEAIASGANLLLTFTNIKNEAGAGNDIFNQSTTVLADLAAAMGTDMSSSAVQLGKALNDPIAGISALTRVGVTFSDQQKEQIKLLVETGDVMGAQKIILAELTKEFGGSAEAQATGLDKAKVAIGNFKEEIGTKLAPAIEVGTDALTGLLSTLDEVGLSTIATSASLGAMIGLRFGGGTGAAIGAVAGSFLGLAGSIKIGDDAMVDFGAHAATVFDGLKARTSDQAAVGFTKAIAAALDDAADKASRWNDISIGGVKVSESAANGFKDYKSNLTELNVAYQVFTEIANKDKGQAQQIIDGLKAKGGATKENAALIAVLEGALRNVVGAEQEHKTATDNATLSQEDAIAKGAEYVSTLQKEEQGVRTLQNALLAAQGGVLGYQAAVNSSEDAQLAYNQAVAEFGPDSEQAQRAQIALQQAQLQVASAAESVINNQTDLNELLNSPTPAALEASRAKLVDFQKQYGDTTGAVQAQIDKTDIAITRWHELHDLPDITKHVTTVFDADIQPLRDALASIGIEPSNENLNAFSVLLLVPNNARVAGGPVGPGTWLVGERGPEMLTLGVGQSGYVTPNDKLGGATHNYIINAPTDDPLALAMGIARRHMVAMLVS